MNILISGALGHIGSKLIRQISLNFNKINLDIVDNIATQRYCSIFDLKKNKNLFINFFDEDLLNFDFNKLKKKPSYIIHLAAKTDAESSLYSKNKFISHNYALTKKVSDFSLKNNVRLIFISSTSVYGTQKTTINESCDIQDLNPQSPYAESKIKEENYIKSLSKKGLKYTILRFGTIYGVSPGIRFHTAVNKFCYQASLNKPITVWKTALNQKRPYLYLDDAINSIFFIIKNNNFDNEIYNVLTSNNSVKEIIKIIKIKNNKTKIKFVNSKIMNQLSYNVENKKLKKLGFKYYGNLKKGVFEILNLLKGIDN